MLAAESIYILPYVLARVFRPTFLDVFNLTNLELGGLFSIYAVSYTHLTLPTTPYV